MLVSASYYSAVTASLSSSSVTSNNVLFVPKWTDVTTAPNDVVCFVGSAMDLENSLMSTNGGGGDDCTAANGCGVHIHSGTSCDDKEGQGGHWYAAELVDPWKLVGYKETNSTGYGKYASCVHTGIDLVSNPDELLGHPFIVHANDGSRVSCGLITEASKDFEPTTLEADTVPIPGTTSSASGKVSVMTPSDLVTDAVCYMGYSKGLENDVKSYLLGTGSDQCNVANGCGAHIHSGNGCADKTEQGGHYFDNTKIAEDPWKIESYYETSASGEAALIGCTITGDGSTDYDSRPFVVHKTDGSRLLCGVLEVHGDSDDSHDSHDSHDSDDSHDSHDSDDSHDSHDSASSSIFRPIIMVVATLIVGVISL